VVVLDPPRAGAKDALAGIALLKPKRIVYVSCDPGTLRRDLGLLAGLGYVATHARGFDMFPHTPHVETVVKLERAPKA
jgi:23S rRNA (uracil1939-C5)-methyltransferase